MTVDVRVRYAGSDRWIVRDGKNEHLGEIVQAGEEYRALDNGCIIAGDPDMEVVIERLVKYRSEKQSRA